MLTKISPRLGRFNIVSNSFAGCVANTPKEFSRTPEVSSLENFPQPRMFLQEFVSRITFEQLQSSANTHCGWHLNKQVDVINSNVQLINFESILVGSLPDKKLAIHSNPIEFHGVSSILALPNKVESILPETMFKTFQIHFFTPKLTRNITAHANFNNLVHGDSINPLDINKLQELNVEDGNSSRCLKAGVSLPLM